MKTKGPGRCWDAANPWGLVGGQVQWNLRLGNPTHRFLQEGPPLFWSFKFTQEDYHRFRKLLFFKKWPFWDSLAFSSFQRGIILGGSDISTPPTAPAQPLITHQIPALFPFGLGNCMSFLLALEIICLRLSWLLLFFPFLFFGGAFFMLLFFLSERWGLGRRKPLSINRETFSPGVSQLSHWQPAPSV